jgi:hypothetical protein
MNTSEIIDLLKKAINSDELADVEMKECQRFIDDIEIVVNDYVEDGTTTEDDIIEKCTEAVEYLRLVNFIDNVQMEKLIELPLILTAEEQPETDAEELEDDEEEPEDVDDDVNDDGDAFDTSSIDC